MIKMKLHIKLAEKRLTRREFAGIMDIRLPTISAYCNDKEKHIPIEHLNKFCEYFDCTVSDLVEYIKES